MFLKNIFQFLKGYVIIVLTGDSIGHFLNICMHRKIKTKTVGQMSDGKVCAVIAASDFKKLGSIARKTHTRVHIKKKCGLKFLRLRYKKRLFFLGGAILFMLSVAVIPQFVWSVEVDGAAKELHDAVIDAAAIAGVKPGALKSKLPDGNEIKNVILLNTGNLTWAWVYLKGTRAIVEVRTASSAPKVIDKSIPCDIAASKDGMITRMTVKDGAARAKKGDVVLKADLLIAGTLENADGTYRLKHALGDVEASTWYRRTAKIKLFRTVKQETGRKKRYSELTIGSKTIPLYKNINIEYEEYSLTQHEFEIFSNLPVLLKTLVYEEETVKRIPIDENEAAKFAQYELEKEISEELLPCSTLEEKQIDTAKIDDETLKVTLSARFTENIGKEIIIKTEEKQE